MDKPLKAHMQIRLDAPLYYQLQQIALRRAAKQDRNVAVCEIAREALKQYVKNHRE